MNKEEMEKRVKDLEAEVESLSQTLEQERTIFMNKEYEMLRRLYPYIANELDAFRTRG
jgi:archaellum component FlaC